jgi:hypothetical protein
VYLLVELHTVKMQGTGCQNVYLKVKFTVLLGLENFHFAVKKRAGLHILPKPDCMCTRLHRVTSKNTNLDTEGRVNLAQHSVKEYLFAKCREKYTHTHTYIHARTGSAVGSSETSSISPPKHGHVA